MDLVEKTRLTHTTNRRMTMSTYALKDMFETTRRAGAVPITPRGRALHTVDWFANGKRRFINYDDPRLELKYIVRGR
jgi:hypothetical protein